MASQVQDAHAGDFVVSWPIPATGTLLPVGNNASGDGVGRPFSVMPLYGVSHISITLQVLAGSTAAGTFTVQVTDFGSVDTPATFDVFQAGFPWAPLYQPSTTTPQTIAIVSGAGVYNILLQNMGASYLRLVYTATSGTGTLNAALTARSIGNS